MNENIKNKLKKMPGMREFFGKLQRFEDELEKVRYENYLLACDNVDLRLKLKKQNHEKINVVFVCHRPAVWGSLHCVYDTLKADDRFQVTIVAIPNKKQLPGLQFSHEYYESEGAEEYWKDYGCIDGYNYETGEWFDLKSLRPDYVFFQQPYNVTRCDLYKSGVVSKYARLAYVSYFPPMAFTEIYETCIPADFIRDLSFFFTQREDDHQYVVSEFKKLTKGGCRIINTGYPKFEYMRKYTGGACDLWREGKAFRAIWTPRWTTNEGNCHFFSFRDLFTELCARTPDLDFVFRPHPQAFQEWESLGQFTKEQREAYLKQIDEAENMHLDQSYDYLPLLYSSDCLISDKSSMIAEYLCTGKPVIYCTSDIEEEIIGEMLRGLYVAHHWEDIEKYLKELMSGRDPLKQIRDEIARDYLGIERNPSEQIKEVLLSD